MKFTRIILLCAALLVSGCGAPTPPRPWGARVPVNVPESSQSTFEQTGRDTDYDDPVYQN